VRSSPRRSRIELEISSACCRPDSKPIPDEDNSYLPELTKYLEAAGINDPFTKVRRIAFGFTITYAGTDIGRVASQIYITSDAVELFPTIIFFFVLSQVPKFYFDKHLGVFESCTLALLQICLWGG
jgi:hypothetical protein